MSRIGKYPVSIPSGVDCNVTPDELVMKGKLGQLSLKINQDVTVTKEDNLIVVTPRNKSKTARSMWGTTRKNIANMVKGVSEGFVKDLEINGVGYRAQVQGKDLVMQLGYSHDVVMRIPDDLQVACEKPTTVQIKGIDPQKVGQFAAEVREHRKPEPYKGKGVKYANEFILRKEGKKK